MPRMRSGAIVAVAAFAVIVAGCGALGGGGWMPPRPPRPPASAAWTPSSRGRPGRRHAQRHRPAARLGELRRVIDAFRPSTASRSTSSSRTSTASRRSTPPTPGGHGRRPDVLDLGADRRAGQHRPVRAVPGRGLGRHPGQPQGGQRPLVSDYAGFMSIGCDAGKVALPATVADLLKPEYKGMVALNGNPQGGAAGFNGVVMASLANGGSADDIAAGRRLLQAAQRRRQPAAGRPDPGDDRLGPDAVRHRLGVQQRRPDRRPRRPGIDWQVVDPDRRPAGRRRTTSRPSTRKPRIRPRPALWEEFLFSPEAQNIWLKGFARPVLQEKMIADGTIDQDGARQARHRRARRSS